MGTMYIVNKLFLGTRELGYELFNGKEVVEMTAKQIINGLKAGKDIRGLKIDEKTNELVLDDKFFAVNMMAHSHINHYEPMLETDCKANVFYTVMEKRMENEKAVYDMVSSRFERVTVSEEKLITWMELGLVSAGAKLENGKIVLPDMSPKTKPEKSDNPVKAESPVAVKVEVPAREEKPVAVKVETPVKKEKAENVKESSKDKK